MRTMVKRFFHTVLLTAVLLACVYVHAAATAEGLDVHFMNIESGDAILIVCDGEAAFIDGGIDNDAKNDVSYMQHLGITQLKYYITTHGHGSHVNGAHIILDKMQVDAVLYSNKNVKEKINFGSVKKIVTAKQIPFIQATVGQVYRVGNAVMTVLGPVQIKNVSRTDEGENDNSLVLRVAYGENTFVLTGDATETGSLKYIDPALLRCDVYKNGHHTAALGMELLEKIAPRYIVYSVDNGKLPSHKTLKNVIEQGIVTMIAATKCNGNIVFHSDGKNITCMPQSSPQSISFKYSETSVFMDKTVKLKAATVPADFQNLVMYSSDDTSIATIDENGVVTGIGLGTTNVHAVLSNGGIAAECVVHVEPVRVTLNSTELHITVGKSEKLKSKTTSGDRLAVTWTSDDATIATVSSNGKVKAVSEGETVIRASLKNGQYAECAVHVEPVRIMLNNMELHITVGKSEKLKSKITSDDRLAVTWTSSAPAIATVSSNGTVKAVSEGETVIRAALKNGQYAECVVCVEPVRIAFKKTATFITLGKNETVRTMISSGDKVPVTWTSDDPSIATVSAYGAIKARNVGETVIHAALQNGQHAECVVTVVYAAAKSVTVKPDTLKMNVGEQKPLKGTVSPNNAEQTLVWTSDDENVVTVDANGCVTAVGAGKTKVRATTQNGHKDYVTVTVRAPQ